ncbi:ribonucleoside triphosphate reductase [Chitinivibrio alkaliphilus]|uniref:Anaerobic ribonucleoside-triphosphate reductase n=1 Tax=Chitinivibrio alkaliphilus ACht1 TaxID=1313304 RepID=U7D9X6_9BACT|nr:ribonucleoside triphosphate reductase [Chitinivibrio alkaliphilus]ERP39209.1 anaerobic ribonucleoside-triphosphate reductase [Chitinivibrio alkaliphilus ACht1]
MIHTVRKRDGRLEPYNRGVISEAIFRAAESVGGEDRAMAEELAVKVEALMEEHFHANSIPAVEQVQDMVEKVLIKNGHAKVAKAYILYREQHRKIRTTKDVLLDIEHTMDGYLKKSDWRVNENSNVNYSLGGLILHNSGAITANYWLENIYTRDISHAHKEGDIHIHDLSMFSGYCAGWSLRQILAEGLGGVPNKISSAPPKHLNTAMHQMVNFLGILQNEWAGAQAFSSLDTYLAPFVWVDDLSYEEVKQAMQSFIFGVNTPSRWGSQAPFTNVTFDWVVPEDMRNQAVVIGGKTYEKTYGDFQKEMDMINRAFLEVFMEGDADGRGFAYPIPTYNITDDFDWEGENTELLFQITGKYGTPYFQNFINSDLNPGDVRSMCCRLQLDKRELRKRGGGLFGADEFTGSIGVVTINLPRIGYLADSRDDFFRRLGHQMDIAKDSLETKREVVKRLLDQGLFPYTRRYLKHWNNHFSTIGLIGMNEAMCNFMDASLTDQEARHFAGEILDFMRGRLQDYQEETGNLYNLEATPGEGTSYRLAKADAERFSDMHISGDDKPYYTNSTQLPVGATDNIFEALDMQDDLQIKYTGGTVFHGFLGEEIRDTATVRALIKKITSQYRLPYFTISPTYSVCDSHGYISGEEFSCPRCGEETEVYSRIVGYYRPLKNWNHGKKSEYDDRRTYSGAPSEQK